jgi:hypothetical protein
VNSSDGKKASGLGSTCWSATIPTARDRLVYVGEAENVQDRIKTHTKDPKKDFWDQVALFSSKDSNLTKAHVKYLESRVVELMRDINRVTLANGNTPPRPSLPRADRDAMEEFLGPMRLLLAALGFTWLQSLAKTSGSDATSPGPSGPLANVLLHFKVPKRGVAAQGYSTDEGLVVLAGSKGDSKVRDSLSKGWRKIREELVADGAIEDTGDGTMFKRDVLFSSPSAAAGVVSGGVWNGRAGWKDEHGTTLGHLEDALIASADAEGG